jgi:methyl-accepting chemotaxis protein
MKLFLDLNRLRFLGNTAVLCILWVHVPLIAAICLARNEAWHLPTLSTVSFAVLTQLTVWRADGNLTARIVPGVALMASISVLVAVLNGNRLQVDLHMYYFAGIAILVGYCDWRAVASASAFVAAHHFLLNFFLPQAIYPGGSDLERFLLHAAVLIAETSALIWISYTMEHIFNALSNEAAQTALALADANASSDAARVANAAAELERAQSEAARGLHAAERTKMVSELGKALYHMANGNLMHRLSNEFTDDFEAIQKDFNSAASALERAIRSVVTKADVIRTTSNEVKAAAEDVTRESEQQVADLQESAVALSAMTSQIAHAVKRSDEAIAIISTAKSSAQKSGEVVRTAVSAMSEIEDAAKQIGQIIGVIDDIAFQTNLLALNAGVEAARAGDAGRGFALVASEVRGLAQRSANAARDIKKLVSNSTQQVERGVQLVGQTGHSLASIIQHVDNIALVVADMASTVRDQSSGVEAMNQTIGHVVAITKHNNTLLQQSTASSRGMALESEDLSQLANQFRVGSA